MEHIFQFVWFSTIEKFCVYWRSCCFQTLMVSTLLLFNPDKSLCKRNDLHPGLPSRRKKNSKWFLIFYDLLHGLWCGLSWSSFDALFVYLFLLCFKFFFLNKKGKNQKNTKTMCVCVYWYLCTLDGHWNKVSQLCITCNLDENLHAQLSNVSFLNHSFWREGLENPKKKT